MKIEIKNRFTGLIIFKHTKENNTISDTVKEYIKQELEKGKASADLRSADLRSANLSNADLSNANLRSADLRSANLSNADLSNANLSYADLSNADLSNANLSYADLSNADLSNANLSYADLSYADLSYADLRSADLRSANLSNANLRYAELDKKYISVGCIGSRKSMTTYCFEDDIIWCGCFRGTLEEFEKKVNETHADNAQYLKEYIGFINYLKSLK
jgi:uncharacterized protein YjbI with pentapeptide repeats